MRDPADMAIIQRLQRELADLRAQVPVRVGIPDQRPKRVLVIGGQSLGTFNSITTYGIKKYSGTLSSVTTQTYDPGTVNPADGTQTGAPSPAITAWPDGLGFGTLWDGHQHSRVIVVNDSRGGAATAMLGGDSSDTTYAPSRRQVRALCNYIISVTKADGSIIRAYSPDIG